MWYVCSKLSSCFPHLPFPRQDLGLRATDSSLSPWEPQRDLKLMLVATGAMGHLGTEKLLGEGKAVS